MLEEEQGAVDTSALPRGPADETRRTEQDSEPASCTHCLHGNSNGPSSLGFRVSGHSLLRDFFFFPLGEAGFETGLLYVASPGYPGLTL